MSRRARRSRWRWPGAVLALASLATFGSGRAQAPAPRAEPERPATACVFRSTVLMPVTDSKALGYANTSRLVVDAGGTAWITVRSRHGRQHDNCLVRVAPPWRTGMSASQTWLEDRDSMDISGAPQRVGAIAAGPGGTIHMAWYGGRVDHQVHYARFRTGPSTKIEDERTPFTVPGFEAVAAGAAKPMELWQEHAAIAVGPDGTVHLAWEARDPSRRAGDGLPRPGIAYATLSPGGAWSVNGVLDRPPYLDVREGSSGQSRPSILVDRAGLVHVLAYGGVGGVQQVLYGTTAGRGFSGWKPIAPSPGDQRHAAGALDAKGRLHVAWREGVADGGPGPVARTAIFYSVRDTDGHWHKPTRLTTADENASTPSVGVTDSSVCVAWVAWTPGAANSDGQVDNGFPADNSTVEGRIEFASSPLGSERFTAPGVIDPGPASYPCWAVGPANGAARPAIVWTSGDAEHVSVEFGWCEPPR